METAAVNNAAVDIELHVSLQHPDFNSRRISRNGIAGSYGTAFF